jgi:anti-sigma regulatory factor (Ser/Thr protein kinase)
MSVDCTFELHVRMDDPTVARTARGWDVGRAVVDDVGLVVSELVSNAVLHGRSAAKLRLCLGECLRVEVLDENTPTCR